MKNTKFKLYRPSGKQVTLQKLIDVAVNNIAISPSDLSSVEFMNSLELTVKSRIKDHIDRLYLDFTRKQS